MRREVGATAPSSRPRTVRRRRVSPTSAAATARCYAGPMRKGFARPPTSCRRLCRKFAAIGATDVVATSADAPSLAATILGMKCGIRLPATLLADTGFASGEAVATLQAHNIEQLVSIGRPQPHRSYNFRPLPTPNPPRRITEPCRFAMKAEVARALCTPGCMPTTPAGPTQHSGVCRSSAALPRTMPLAAISSLSMILNHGSQNMV